MVEIIYIDPDGEVIVHSLPWEPGMTIQIAMDRSDFYASCPQARGLPLGIFSRPATLTTELQPNDRVECYRPLVADPKDRRRAKASQGMRTK